MRGKMLTMSDNVQGQHFSAEGWGGWEGKGRQLTAAGWIQQTVYLEPAVLRKREMDPDTRPARPREHHSHKE